MKSYNNKITLVENSRGVYDLDTSKGCMCGLSHNSKGCYSSCYAASFARQYGYNFNNTIVRNFESVNHFFSIIDQIKSIDMPFIRIGNSGDPSECWRHTINVCKQISIANKPIVIITKHWNEIPHGLIKDIEKLNVCINTSISAMDTQIQLKYRLKQYNKLKNVCNSVLRIVSCDFNIKNLTGLGLSLIQDNLFNNKKTIDTIFRTSLNNKLVLNNIINIKKVKFLTSNIYASIRDNNTYFRDCKNCLEMCGINL